MRVKSRTIRIGTDCDRDMSKISSLNFNFDDSEGIPFFCYYSMYTSLKMVCPSRRQLFFTVK